MTLQLIPIEQQLSNRLQLIDLLFLLVDDIVKGLFLLLIDHQLILYLNLSFLTYQTNSCI